MVDVSVAMGQCGVTMLHFLILFSWVISSSFACNTNINQDRIDEFEKYYRKQVMDMEFKKMTKEHQRISDDFDLYNYHNLKDIYRYINEVRKADFQVCLFF